MDRTTPHRAVICLSLVVSCISIGSLLQRVAVAQVAPAQSPAGQPTWINQTPMFQVGPNGAVNLDQTQPYTAAQFPGATYPPQSYTVGQAPGATYPPQTFSTQALANQAVVQQPAWGAPWTPATNVGGSIPYFFLHRSSVFGEFLYMRPRDAEVAYAVPVEEPAVVLDGDFDPMGPVAVIDPEYDPAFRVGGNLAVSDGASIAVQYTRLRSETFSTAAGNEDVVLLPLVLLPFDEFDAFLDPTEIEFVNANAQLNIDLDMADLDFRGLWAGCECNDYAFAVNYIGGVRYAKLDQTFNANFVEEDADDSAFMNSAIRFDGIGMRFGLEGERFFPASGLFVYGSGISNILFGEFDASFQEFEIDDGVTENEGFTSWNAGRVVPVVDLELGAGWMGMNRHLRLSAGYRVSAWFNVVKTEDWIWAVQNNDFRNLDGTLTFDGLVARAEWLF